MKNLLLVLNSVFSEETKGNKYLAKVSGVKFKMLSILAAFLKQRNQQQHLTDIPDEIILKIFSYLSIQDLGKWTKMSKRFRNICWDKALPYGAMTQKQNKGRLPEFRQLLRDIRNPKISSRQKHERFINTLNGNLDLKAHVLKNQKDFIQCFAVIFRENPHLISVFLNKQQYQRHQQHQQQHQQTVQQTDESVRTHFSNQPNRSQQDRGFFLRFLCQLARFSCINCF
jgi:hemerythrin